MEEIAYKPRGEAWDTLPLGLGWIRPWPPGQ